MESETIRPGQTLRIPGASGTVAAASATTSPARPAAAAARPRQHTVGDGETLWGIARRYEVSVDSLRRANDLREDQHIPPGQTLVIPED